MPKAGTAANLASSGVRSIVVAARAALQLGAASGTRASDGCRLQPTSRRMRRRACCWPYRRTHLTKVMAGRVHGRTRWAGPFRRRHGHSTDVGPALGFQAHGAHCRQRCIDGGAHFARPVCIGHGGVRIRFENERVLTPPLDLLWEVNSTHTPPPVERALYNPIHKPAASTRRWATQKVCSRTKIRRAAQLAARVACLSEADKGTTLAASYSDDGRKTWPWCPATWSCSHQHRHTRAACGLPRALNPACRADTLTIRTRHESCGMFAK